MGFDAWGSSRVDAPSAPVSTEQQVAQALAEQRADSRALPGGQRSRRSSRSGALTITEYSVAAVDAADTEGVVDVAGLYIVKAKATVSGTAGSGAWMDLSGAGSGSEWVNGAATPIPASATDYPLRCSGVAWCEAGVTLSSSITGATVTGHSLTYTLIEVS